MFTCMGPYQGFGGSGEDGHLFSGIYEKDGHLFSGIWGKGQFTFKNMGSKQLFWGLGNRGLRKKTFKGPYGL